MDEPRAGGAHWGPARLSRRAVLAGGTAAALAGGLGLLGCSSGSGPSGPRARAVAYGSGRHQVGDLWLPTARSATSAATVVLLHGDFWEPTGSRHTLDPLARAVAEHGWAAWNLDYRLLGQGGGWPTSYVDVAAAVDHVAAMATEHHLDPDRVAVLGLAGGATLALWTAARYRLPAKAPGAGPKVDPAAVVTIAGLNNLRAAYYAETGGDAVQRWVHAAPTDGVDDYTVASPIELLPFGIPQLVVYGTADPIVPANQSVAYAGKASRAGDDATLMAISGAGHFDLVDPDKAAWRRIVAKLDHILAL